MFSVLKMFFLVHLNIFIIPFAVCLQFRMADSGSSDPSGQRVPTPGGSGRGLMIGRRGSSSAISPGRLPSMRSRDLTLGGVKKVICCFASPRSVRGNYSRPAAQ